MGLPERSPGYLLEGPRGTRLSRRTAAARRRSCGDVANTRLFIGFQELLSVERLKKKNNAFILTEPDCSECSARARSQTGTRPRRGQTRTGRSSGPAAAEEAPAIGPCIPPPATRKGKKKSGKNQNSKRGNGKKEGEKREPF